MQAPMAPVRAAPGLVAARCRNPQPDLGRQPRGFASTRLGCVIPASRQAGKWANGQMEWANGDSLFSSLDRNIAEYRLPGPRFRNCSVPDEAADCRRAGSVRFGELGCTRASGNVTLRLGDGPKLLV